MPGAQFSPADFAEATATLGGWLKEGKIADEHTIMDGFDQLPAALSVLQHMARIRL